MVKTENFQQIEVDSIEELHDWFLKNHTQKETVWLVAYKKIVPEKYIQHDKILDELIIFGWIDGIFRKLDEERIMTLISPRKVQHWAKSYKDRYARLELEGRMHESGRKAVEISKGNGLWTFMDDVDALIKPEDFLDCLKKHGKALEYFNNFGGSHQRFTLRWIKLAKTSETRAKRIQLASELAAKNKKIPGL